MDRRGVTTKVFIFAISVITLGFLVMLSTRFIDSVQDTVERSAMVKFEKKLQDDVDAIRSKTAKRIIEYNLPSNYEELCILDSRAEAEDVANRPFMKNALQDNAKDNVFMFAFNDQNKIGISHLGVMVYPFFSCKAIDRGRVKLAITGRANQAYVYPDPDPDFCQVAQDSTPSTCHLLDGIYEGYSSKCCQLYELCC